VGAHCQTGGIAAKILSFRIGYEVCETDKTVHRCDNDDFIEIHIFAEVWITLKLKDAYCHNLNKNSKEQRDHLDRNLVLVNH